MKNTESHRKYRILYDSKGRWMITENNSIELILKLKKINLTVPTIRLVHIYNIDVKCLTLKHKMSSARKNAQFSENETELNKDEL